MGIALLSAVLVLGAPAELERAGLVPALAGAAAYLIGTFGVTMAANVPLNNWLAATDTAATDAAKVWTDC